MKKPVELDKFIAVVKSHRRSWLNLLNALLPLPGSGVE